MKQSINNASRICTFSFKRALSRHKVFFKPHSLEAIQRLLKAHSLRLTRINSLSEHCTEFLTRHSPEHFLPSSSEFRNTGKERLHKFVGKPLGPTVDSHQSFHLKVALKRTGLKDVLGSQARFPLRAQLLDGANMSLRRPKS